MFKYNSETPFFDMLVPTIDTVRFGYLMEKLLAVNRSVLYTGITQCCSVLSDKLTQANQNIQAKLSISLALCFK